MTAARTAFDLGAPAPAHAGGRSIPLGPAEGWTSLVLLALMAALVGWSIDDARWVLGTEHLTDFLPYAGIAGVLAGFTAAKVGWGRFVAHLVCAVFAALFLGLAVGAQLRPGGAPHDLFVAAGESVTGAWYDLVVLAKSTTSEVGHFLLLLGGLCWGTGQYAAYTAVAHRRPVSAVLVPGAVLLANVSLTVRDQYGVIVVFTLAALLVLVRLHVVDEQRAWLRHRVGDVGGAIGAYLRAGLSFVLVAVIGALVLTSVASSAPLAGFWQGVPQQLVDLGNRLARLFPAGGATRVGGVTFGSSATVRGIWVTDGSPVLRIHVPDRDPYRWRATAYDRFDGTTWSWGDPAEVTVAANAALLGGTRDDTEPAVAYRELEFQVSGVSGPPGMVVAPGVPLSVDRGTRVTVVRSGADAFFAQIPVGGGSYAVTAAVPVVDPAVDGAITANRLRVAGTDYPAEVLALYTDVGDGIVGPQTKSLLSTILERARADNPYDIARAIEAYLRDGANFHYQVDVTDVGAECRDKGVVECFVVTRRGYCEHYASTMAMMLREMGIPARLVMGYLPSTPGSDGVQVIAKSQAHAWVEAWFPGAGWVEFDPTGGGVGIASNLPAGSPIPSVAPSPVVSHAPPTPRRTPRDRGEPDGGGVIIPPAASSGGIGPAIVLLILAVPLGILGWAWWWRRRPAKPVEPDVAYRTIERFASRLGHPPRPTQTVYEYVGVLGDALPVARPELQLVARAKVESTYGRKRLPPDRLRALGEAQRRLRLVLLRLGLRRRR